MSYALVVYDTPNSLGTLTEQEKQVVYCRHSVGERPPLRPEDHPLGCLFDGRSRAT